MYVLVSTGMACEHVGFLVITNHGVDSEVIGNAWDDTMAFFDQSVDVKCGGDAHTLLMTDEFPYGYSPYGGEVLAKGKVTTPVRNGGRLHTC